MIKLIILSWYDQSNRLFVCLYFRIGFYRWGCHNVRLHNHSGPYLHSWFSWSAIPPLLPKSAGFSCDGTCLHSTSWFSLIFRTRFSTNCLYSPFPRTQCKGTLLSSQQISVDTGNLSSASRTLVNRLTAKCPDSNSRRGMVRPCFASLDFAATSPWLTSDDYVTTA